MVIDRSLHLLMLTLIGCALASGFASCRVAVDPGASHTGYIRLLDADNFQNAVVMRKAADGGLFVFTTVQSNGDTLAELIKCSITGDVQWKKQYGDSLFSSDLVPLTDGGAMLLARYHLGSKAIVISLLHVDDRGVLLPDGRRDFFKRRNVENSGYSIRVTADGGYIVSDVVTESLENPSTREPGNLHLSSTFDTMWHEGAVGNYVPGKPNTYTPSDMALTGAGFPLIVGTFQTSATPAGITPRLLLGLSDGFDTLIEAPTLTGTPWNGYGNYRGIVDLGQDNFILLGDSTGYGGNAPQYAYAGKISGSDFKLAWRFSSRPSNLEKSSFLAGASLDDGGFVATGFAGPLIGGTSSILLGRFDRNGNSLWLKTYDFGGSDIGQSIVTTPDGGYIVAGVTSSYGSSGGANQVFLIRFNADGEYVQ